MHLLVFVSSDQLNPFIHFHLGHPSGFTHTKWGYGTSGSRLPSLSGGLEGLAGVPGFEPSDDVDVAVFFDALLAKFLLPLSFSCVASQ